MTRQLQLFPDEAMTQVARPRAKRPSGGSGNPIVFHDYESFVAKFSDNPKTTDDCYTPQDIFETVVAYVGTVTDLSDKVVLRPFYPAAITRTPTIPKTGWSSTTLRSPSSRRL